MTIKCKKIFIYLFLSFFCFLSIKGQQLEDYVEVRGVVKSANEEQPLQAIIKFNNHPHYDHQGVAKSNKDGEYTLFLKKEENYAIEFIADGHLKYRKSSVYYDSLENQNITLHPKEEGQNILSNEIYFERGNDNLVNDSEASLDSLFMILSANPEIDVQIEGHTDFRGDEDLNYKLSKKRTEQVKNYLVKKGIDSKRIKLKAFGEARPIVLNGSENERSKNRRVEVKILNF